MKFILPASLPVFLTCSHFALKTTYSQSLHVPTRFNDSNYSRYVQENNQDERLESILLVLSMNFHGSGKLVIICFKNYSLFYLNGRKQRQLQTESFHSLVYSPSAYTAKPRPGQSHPRRQPEFPMWMAGTCVSEPSFVISQGGYQQESEAKKGLQSRYSDIVYQSLKWYFRHGNKGIMLSLLCVNLPQ